MHSPPMPSDDRRKRLDRRGGDDRRHPAVVLVPSMPTGQEQRVQFFTRYLFLVLGLLFFNLAKGHDPAWLSLRLINICFLLYFLANTLFFLHAWKVPVSSFRYRLAMWVDIAIVSVAVLNDPNPLPPSVLVFIMVVLGNGMRYGMRIFAEALFATFVAVLIVFSLRFAGGVQEFSFGLVFLILFGAIILVYSFILMGRIEVTRKELERHSRIDPLTGIMNRRALFELAELMFHHAQRHQSRLAVLFADLDKFKAINDLYGHGVGDRVLRDFARILQENLRASDLLARLGGDEFVMLLPETNLDRAEQAALRIQAMVQEYAKRKGYDFSVTIGLGEAPAQGDSLAVILDRVDAALYESKSEMNRGGIRRVCKTQPQAAQEVKRG